MTAEAAIDIAEIVDRLNRLAAGQRGQPRWNRWKVRRLLEAGGVVFTQKRRGEGARGTKLYVLLDDLKHAFPKFWESLLDAEALAEDGVEA